MRWNFRLPDGTLEQGAKGKPKKKINQRRHPTGDQDKWIWNLGDVEHGLYKLMELREVGQDETIFVCEGEPKVDLLREWGLPATCNSGGSKNWRPDHAQALAGRDVVILIDHDEAGRAYGQAVAKSLDGIATRVRILDLAAEWSTAPKGADIVDWKKYQEGTREELLELVEQTPDWVPQPAAAGDDIDQLRWHGEAPDVEQRWLVKSLLPEVGTALLSGQWGTGKTFVGLDLAASVMTGTPFAGRRVVRRGGVLFFATDGAFEIPIRLQGLVVAKIRPSKTNDFGPSGQERLPFVWAEQCPRLLDPSALGVLEAIAKQADQRMREQWRLPLALIMFDTMMAAAGYKDESSSAEGQTVMNVLAALARKTGSLAVGVDHFGKNVETGTRGTSAKESAADAVLATLGEREPSGRVENLRLAVRKLRGGPSGIETPFELQDTPLSGPTATTTRSRRLSLPGSRQWPPKTRTRPKPRHLRHARPRGCASCSGP